MVNGIYQQQSYCFIKQNNPKVLSDNKYLPPVVGINNHTPTKFNDKVRMLKQQLHK